jgi:hypothetical protein
MSTHARIVDLAVLKVTISEFDSALACLSGLRRERAPVKERRVQLARMIGLEKRLAKLVSQNVGRHILTTGGSSPKQWMLSLLIDVKKALLIARLYYSPELDAGNLAEEESERARLHRSFGERMLLLQSLPALASDAGPDDVPPPAEEAPLPRWKQDYVTLSQMAALVNHSKRTLEKRKGRKKNPLPDPDVEGGGGKPDEWLWETVRPWLEGEFCRLLPERFPGGLADRS